MKSSSTVRRAGVVLAALAVLGIGTASTASAKSVWALLTDQNSATPTGTTYSTSTGYAMYAQTNGYDSVGALNCVARSFNNQTTVTSPCTTAAAKYQSYVRNVNATFCTTAQNNWSGMIVACHSGPLPICSSVAGCGGLIDLGVWGRGQ